MLGMSLHRLAGVALGSAVGLAGLTTSANAALPPALAAAYARDANRQDFDCHASDLVKNGKQDIKTLATGQRLHFVQGQCGCGASNCSVGVYIADGDAYRKLVMSLTQDYHVGADGTLVMEGEDDAWVSGRSTYHWTGHDYVLTADEMVWEGKYAKPVTMPVTFAAGASSTILRGDRVTERFTDNYTFAAAKGQELTLAFLARDPKVDNVTVGYLPSPDAEPQTVTLARNGPRFSAKLPSNGTYSLVIGGEGETFRSYSMKISIH